MITNIPRIGFACKINTAPGLVDSKLNTKSTTIAWLSKQSKDAIYEKLAAIAKYNLAALKQQLAYVGNLPPSARMFRITSDLLPAYTHDDYMWVYQEREIQDLLASGFALCGEQARKSDIRLSFHPGQFCVLASDNPSTVENSIYEFEYHADVARWMGYGKSFQDFKINVHIGGKAGPQGIKAALPKLSTVARNCLTIENAEFSWGLDASLELVKDCALVLDIHHHWIMAGEYIMPNDTRVLKLIESWRGTRPVIHYTVSRLEHVAHLPTDQPYSLKELLASGLTRAKLRAHSDYYHNTWCNSWAKEFWPTFDIMCESKEKNLASFKLYKELL